jgi:hypothetical protein
MSRTVSISVLFALLFFFMLGVWTIDISVGAMNVGGKLSNGWWTRDPFVQYHIGLYMAIISAFCMGLIALNLALGDRHEETFSQRRPDSRLRAKGIIGRR